MTVLRKLFVIKCTTVGFICIFYIASKEVNLNVSMVALEGILMIKLLRNDTEKKNELKRKKECQEAKKTLEKIL